MSVLSILPSKALHGTLQVPGDKSISHRCLIFGALATGTSVFEGLSSGEDVQSTQRCLEQLGVSFEQVSTSQMVVHGVGLHGFKAPEGPLDCGNSGTTLRLLMGILAAQPFDSTLTGDASLRGRPMTRVSNPLQQLGGRFHLHQDRFAPVHITGVLSRDISPLSGGEYTLQVASAQVKSALLLAGFYSREAITLNGLIQSRDHTEKMLPDFGVALDIGPEHIRLPAQQALSASHFKVPGDPSSAAFWLVAAALIPGSEVCIEGVSLNPTRTGLFEVLRRMGADIHWEITSPQAEPLGKVRLRYRPLKGTTIHAAEIPALVDEVPLIALLATQAQGTTRVEGAEELRVKECDRLAAMHTNLQAMGVRYTENREDGFTIQGPQALSAAQWASYHDHRIAMTGVLAGLITQQGTHQIMGAESIAVSYPSFLADLGRLQATS